jgi:penicillin-binding protein 1A
VIYGDTPKSDVLENKDVEDVATSQDRKTPACLRSRSWAGEPVAGGASGAPEYAPHVINTLAFLIKSALNTNIFGEPGWMGTGWRAGAICSATISAVKPGPPTVQKMRGSRATVLAW